MSAYIIGSGICLPDRVVANEDLAETLVINPERIFKSSGIKRRRWADPGTPLSMLFGDGASALVVSAEPNSGAIEILDVYLATDGDYADDLGIRSPGTEFRTTNPADFSPRMNGQSVILHASRRIVAACRTLLERNELTSQDIRWIVPHQANANLLAQIARGLGIARPDGVVSVIEDFGNTSSASMGIALDKLRRAGRVEVGHSLLLPAFAAGFTWGAALCRA